MQPTTFADYCKTSLVVHILEVSFFRKRRWSLVAHYIILSCDIGNAFISIRFVPNDCTGIYFCTFCKLYLYEIIILIIIVDFTLKNEPPNLR